eukprot:5946034-Karenia_brevis.AAC.1
MKLLPLRIRRQISILGVTKRATLRRGPSQLWAWLQRDIFNGYNSMIKHTRPLKPLIHHQSPDYLLRSCL